MKKIFNYRPLVSICLFLMAGIIFVVGIYSKSAIRIVISSLMVALLVATFFVKLFLAKDHKIFKLVSIFVAFAVGVIASICTIEVHEARQTLSGDYYITGRVSVRSYRTDKGKVALTLDEVKAVSLENSSVYSLDGKVRIYLVAGDERCLDFQLGDRVMAVSSLEKLDLFSKSSKYNLAYLTKQINAIGFGSEDDVALSGESDPSIFDSIKNKVKVILDKNMSKDYSELAYTMLFGDKAGLSDEMEESYYNSGIGHLLAVSGLHVGFVVTMIGLFLSLFKANNKVRFFVISICVFLYAFLCGLSTSVTRALIMTIVLLYAKMRYREYDGLSSLAFAGIIILIFSPLQLYTLGFQLSFGAVAAIILLCRPLQAFFERFFYEKFSSALALTISATIGVLPFAAISLKKLSLFSIVTNVIAVPIASVGFMTLVPVAFLSLILKFLAPLTLVFEFLMRIVTGISQLTGAISLVSCSEALLVAFGVGVVTLGVVSSDYIFSSKKSKAIALSSVGGVTLALFILSLVL